MPSSGFDCDRAHNPLDAQIVLSSDAWINHLPGTIQAVFFPVGGDELKAREMHASFVRTFSFRPSQLPLLQLDVSDAERPFRPALQAATHAASSMIQQSAAGRASFGTSAHKSKTLSSQRCDDILGQAEGKFSAMWGKTAWKKTMPKEPRCWGHRADAELFFEQLKTGKECDANWYEGAQGSLGEQNARPPFTAPAPALLGFDESIFSYCSSAIGRKPGYQGRPEDFNDELARRCVEANMNILRILSARVPWNMCQNLRWVVCAANGKLPGQDGQTLQFAEAPNRLDLDEWEHPHSWPCDDGECGEQFAVGDVFFAEACILNRVCLNGDDLFELDPGVSWTCDFDANGYEQLVASLLGQR